MQKSTGYYFEAKGQGALEYLLLIGGAILVAVIVISILVTLGGSSGDEAIIATANAQCAKYPLEECDLQTVESGGQNFKCYPFGKNICRAKLGIEITACGGPPGGFQPGGIYFVNSPIAGSGTCLLVNQNNVALNCKNNFVGIVGLNSAGIEIAGSNIFLANCNASGNGLGTRGIAVTGSNNIIFKNTPVGISPSSDAIFVSGQNNVLIGNNTCGSPINQRRITISATGGLQSNESSGNICNFCTDNDDWTGGPDSTICTKQTTSATTECPTTCT